MPYRYNVEWTIPNAGPSISVFHFADGTQPTIQAAVHALRTAFQTINRYIPDDITLNFPAEFVRVDARTGQTTEFLNLVPPASVVGGVSGGWAAGAGARLVYATDTVARGRRVRGATYLVPMASSVFGTNGQVTPTVIGEVTSAWQQFIADATAAGTHLGVLSRPISGEPGTGFFARVTGVAVSPRAATLRGRKY